MTPPYFSPQRHAMDDPPRFTGQFDRPADEAKRAWSVFLPRFTNGVEIAVNDVVILDSRRDPTANRPDRNTPVIAVIPSSLLRDGANTVSIRLFIWGPITGFLERVWVGPDDKLRPSYNLRSLIFVTLPVVFSSWQAILAVILGIMWVMRRHEPAYGLLAAAMAVGVAQAFLQTPMGETAFSRLNVVLISSAPIESALVLTFALLFSGWKWRPYGWIIFVPGLLLALAGLFGNQALSRTLFLYLAVPMVGLSLVIMAVVTARSTLKRRNVASLLLGCRGHDHAHLLDRRPALGVSDDAEPHLHRAAVLFGDAGRDRRRADMAVCAGTERGRRFCRTPGHPGARSRREAQGELHPRGGAGPRRGAGAGTNPADARPARRARRPARQHRGAERARQCRRGIGDAARAALKDLRLVIDSMDDIGGDLMLALGSWRERAMAQLRPHDIALEWRAVTPQGLPVHPELRPWHVIQIVRLLDEALTNAVKHANARRVTVRIETLVDHDGHDRGCITVEDDGRGFDVPPADGSAGAMKAARGLRNMRNRAARCGAELVLDSCDQGTRVRLTLPHRFPDSDAAAG